jgi:hypothetical protein
MPFGVPVPQTNHRFKFELGWLHRVGFHDMVKGVWERTTCVMSPIQRWNNKIRTLCSHLSGWAKHESSILKKEKQRLSSIINDLEDLAKVRLLHRSLRLKINQTPNRKATLCGGTQMVPTVKKSISYSTGCKYEVFS